MIEHNYAKTDQELFDRLTEPFPLNMVLFRPGTMKKDKTGALALPYIDSRNMMWRLDRVAGSMNWQSNIRTEAGIVTTGIGVKSPETGIWVWKWGMGASERTGLAGELGKSTKAFKRAAAEWGIGRYLYHFPKIWCAGVLKNGKYFNFNETPNIEALGLTWAMPYPANLTGPIRVLPELPEIVVSDEEEEVELTQDPETEEELDENEITYGDVMTFATEKAGMGMKEARVWLEEKKQTRSPHEMMYLLKESVP